MLSTLDVDPALGVIGNELTFTDSDYQPLFEFETAPSKLKRKSTNLPIARCIKPFPETRR